jgi:hypothetical protein
LAKHPFRNHSLPKKILPNCILFSLLWIPQKYIFFTKQDREPCDQPPNLEDHVPVFISPSDRVAQLYSKVPGSLFVVFYESQGDGGFVSSLQTGSKWGKLNNLLLKFRVWNRRVCLLDTNIQNCHWLSRFRNQTLHWEIITRQKLQTASRCASCFGAWQLNGRSH